MNAAVSGGVGKIGAEALGRSWILINSFPAHCQVFFQKSCALRPLPDDKLFQDIFRVRVLVQDEQNIPRIDVDRALERLLKDIISDDRLPIAIECDSNEFA